MMDEARIRAQLADYQRQLDWVTGAIQALKAVLEPPAPTEAQGQTVEPPA